MSGMQTPPSVEKVPLNPPEGGTPPPSGGSKKGAGKGLAGVKLDKKTAMVGGAVVVALVAYASSRGGSGEVESEPLEVAELDTSATDIYNDLQPELEKLTDAIEGFRDNPAPAKPKPAEGKKPSKPKPSPKPGRKPAPKKRRPAKRKRPVPTKKRPPAKGAQRRNRRRYTIQRGDTLSHIARRHKVRGGYTRLYALNRRVIERAARAHGRKGSGGGRWIYPGTTLVIP